MSRPTDSVYAADTLINGKVYSVTKGTFLGTPRIKITRDSADYELSYPNSKVNFTLDPLHQRIDTLFYPGGPLAVLYTRTKGEELQVDVPAGLFDAIEVEQRVEPATDTLDVNFCHQYYAKNTGLIKNQVFLFARGIVWAQKLVRYNVEPKKNTSR